MAMYVFTKSKSEACFKVTHLVGGYFVTNCNVDKTYECIVKRKVWKISGVEKWDRISRIRATEKV